MIRIRLQPEDSRLLGAAIASGRLETNTATNIEIDTLPVWRRVSEHSRLRDPIEHRTEDDRRAGGVNRGATYVLTLTGP